MPELPPQQWAQVEAAIFAGRKIEAIRLYREAVPGMGLAAAKEAVEKMEADLRQAAPEKFGGSARKRGCTGLLAAGALLTVAAVIVMLLALTH